MFNWLRYERMTHEQRCIYLANKLLEETQNAGQKLGSKYNTGVGIYQSYTGELVVGGYGEPPTDKGIRGELTAKIKEEVCSE